VHDGVEHVLISHVNDEEVRKHLQVIDEHLHVLISEQKNLEYQKELEKEVEEKTAELEDAYKLLREEFSRRVKFMRETSHEFINPLSIIKGYLTLLLMHELSEEHRRRLLNISENVEKISQLVQDALEVSYYTNNEGRDKK